MLEQLSSQVRFKLHHAKHRICPITVARTTIYHPKNFFLIGELSTVHKSNRGKNNDPTSTVFVQDQGLLMPEELSSQVDEAGGARYSVQSTGLDHVTFMLAAAPQEPFRPLSGVASGGESARTMLAMKAAPLAIGAAENGALTGETITVCTAVFL